MGRRPKEECITLKYNGTLDGAKTIWLHYGIGEAWEGVSECKMRKLKYCYKTEVTIPTGADLNFCFRDQDGNWDNNSGFDYKYNSLSTTVPTYPSVEVAPITKKK
jgi:hypothetical protein